MTTLISMANPMRLARRSATWLILASLAVAGCSGNDDFVPGVPTKLALEKEAFTFTSLGQSQLFLATATDGGGDPVSTPLNWSTSDPAIVKINGDGLATAISPGEATVMVSYGTLSSEMAVTITQTPVHLAIGLGDRQHAAPSTVLNTPLTVIVTDALYSRVAGAQVQFATTSPGASISPTTLVTADEFGQAAATMTLGSALGAYTATATLPGTDASVTFNETAAIPGPFDIEVVFVNGSPTAAQADAFAQAEARWEEIITADLPDDHATLDPYACGNPTAVDRPIDDLVIFVDLGEIDGSGGILGQSGVCFLHDVGLLPAIGQMRLDVADLNDLEASGVLVPVIIHEMGHVLGIGTLWDSQGLLADASLSGGTDPHFTGTNALAAFETVGGDTYVGAKVPVENQGGYGTADAHWRESVFTNELMTGYIGAGENPLSVVTIASLQDNGYEVDLSKADAFSILALLRTGPSKTIKLHNDILGGPIRIINKQGRIVGTYRK